MSTRRSSKLLRIAQLLVFITLLGFSFAAPGQAKRGHEDPSSVPATPATADSGSFHDRIQKLRNLSAEAAVTQQLIESLDELDDMELTRLRVPKQVLGAGASKAGARRLHAGYGGESYAEKRRSLAAYP